MVSNAELIRFLEKTTVHSGFVDKLKIKYRPVVCPFDDLLEQIGNSESVFDIGCGSGQFCLVAANFSSVKKLMGIEISQRLVDNATSLSVQHGSGKEFRFEKYDGITFPSELRNYQTVFLIDVFHHVPVRIQNEFLKKIYDAMRPGAKFIFKDIDAGTPFVYFNKMHDLIFSREIGHEVTSAKAVSMLREIGFRISREYSKRVFVYPHYFIIAEK